MPARHRGILTGHGLTLASFTSDGIHKKASYRIFAMPELLGLTSGPHYEKTEESVDNVAHDTYDGLRSFSIMFDGYGAPVFNVLVAI